MNRHQDRGPLYTLSQVSERTGIHSMLLDSYLHTAAWRVPTVWIAGEERYPREALTAFQELHEEAQAASAPVADTRPAEAEGSGWGRRRLLSITAQRRNGASRSADSNGHGAGRPAAPAAVAAPEPEPEVEPETAAAEQTEAAIPEEPLPPRRPTRQLFTLQQVHEHTGIPYPTLALYAASEAGRIPAAGERYAPLYPWEALFVFCDLHQQRNPAWQPPSLPAAPPAPEDDEAARELADRIERLERAQAQLAAQIRMLIEEDEPYLTTTVSAIRATA